MATSIWPTFVTFRVRVLHITYVSHYITRINSEGGSDNTVGSQVKMNMQEISKYVKFPTDLSSFLFVKRGILLLFEYLFKNQDFQLSLLACIETDWPRSFLAFDTLHYLPHNELFWDKLFHAKMFMYSYTLDHWTRALSRKSVHNLIFLVQFWVSLVKKKRSKESITRIAGDASEAESTTALECSRSDFAACSAILTRLKTACTWIVASALANVLAYYCTIDQIDDSATNSQLRNTCTDLTS